MTPDPKGQAVNALPEQITEVLREHRRIDAHNSETNRDCWYCECSDQAEIRRFKTLDEYDAHVAEQVTDLLLDLAGTGQLLASIDQIARPTVSDTDRGLET